jgi:hypothetical protein
MIKIIEAILVGLLLVFFLTDFPKQAVHRHRSNYEVVGEVSRSKYFSGRGMWIWNEIRKSKNGFKAYVEKAKDNGLDYVIVKAFDGSEWGVPDSDSKKKEFQTQLNQPMITAFHDAGIKCYAFGTTWLYPESNVDEAIRHAINTLHKTSADGIIFDDVFAYGCDEKQTEKLFSAVRHHMDSCERCRKKTLAFSTFPSIWRRELPWQIPLKYADCFMPQIYWQALKKTPDEAVKKFQDSWQEYCKSHKNIRSEIVPVVPMTGEKVTPEQIEQFISSAKKVGWKDLACFRWSSTSAQDWQRIKDKEI